MPAHRETGKAGLSAKVARFLERTRRAGAPLWYLKVGAGPYQRPGIPDYLISAGGHLLAVELKAPSVDPVPDPLQRVELQRLGASGATATCLNDLRSVEALVLAALRREAGWTLQEA